MSTSPVVVSLDLESAAAATGYGTDTIRAAVKRGDLIAHYAEAAPTKPVFLLRELEEWIANSPTVSKRDRNKHVA